MENAANFTNSAANFVVVTEWPVKTTLFLLFVVLLAWSPVGKILAAAW